MKKQDKLNEHNLQKFLQEAKGNVHDIFYDVYEQFLKNAESPENLLQVIFEFTGRIGSYEEESIKVPIKIQEEVEQHRSDIKDIATKIAKENYAPEIYYANLWKEIFVAESFSQTSEHCAVLLRILNEFVPVLPYYQAVDLFRMEESEFKESLERISSGIIESTHMLNRHFEQKTETTSQLCRIAEKLAPQDAYVYWATIISLIEKSSYRAGYSRAVSEIKKKLDTNIDDE